MEQWRHATREGDLVTYRMIDRAAVVTIDRPGALNAIDEGVLSGLFEAIARASGDPEVKAVVVTGAGDAFCVGLDIGLLGRAFANHDYFRDVLTRFHRLLLDIEAAPFPVIAAANGLARAGGFELLLACDLVLVADEARIGDTHLSFGVMPGGGATARAAWKLGEHRARDLLLTGRWMDAREAVAGGLALRSVPRAHVLDEALELANSFAGRSRTALAATKAAMRATHDGEQAMQNELELFMEFLRTEKADEGYRAFVEKRAPEWP
jgi:enoyl-CoA hydratase/carnithine racemase